VHHGLKELLSLQQEKAIHHENPRTAEIIWLINANLKLVK
jgi:hypothetical protein